MRHSTWIRNSVLTASAFVALISLGMTQASATPSSPAGQLDLKSAPVPAGMCTHPAGNLKDGSRSFGVHGGDYIRSTAFGTINNGATALAVMQCTAGGVAWPDTIVFYRKGSDGKAAMVASYDTAKLIDAEHVVAKKLAIKNGIVHGQFESYDGAGIVVQPITANLQIKNNTVVVTNVHRGKVIDHS